MTTDNRFSLVVAAVRTLVSVAVAERVVVLGRKAVLPGANAKAAGAEKTRAAAAIFMMDVGWVDEKLGSQGNGWLQQREEARSSTQTMDVAQWEIYF